VSIPETTSHPAIVSSPKINCHPGSLLQLLGALLVAMVGSNDLEGVDEGSADGVPLGSKVGDTECNCDPPH